MRELPVLPMPAPETPADDAGSLRSASQAVRVDIRKLDRLMTVVGELVLVKSSLLATSERLKATGLDPVLGAELQRQTRSFERRLDELQAGILEVRMVPLEQVFEKLARMVRKLARDVGKDRPQDFFGFGETRARIQHARSGRGVFCLHRRPSSVARSGSARFLCAGPSRTARARCSRGLR